MKRIRIIGVCLVAACAMSLAASSVASAAAPEFTTKAAVSSVPVATGPVAFKGTFGASYVQGKISGFANRVYCSDVPPGAGMIGEVTEPKRVENTVSTLTGCEKPFGSGKPCENAGQAKS